MLPERLRATRRWVLEVEDFDLILLDLLMPDLNGFQVLERLKADERWHDIPVIMISGLQETDSVIRCIEAGAEDYLAKPFNPVLLRARIGACLERKRWRDRERRYVERIELEEQRYETLLRNILPGQIVSRLNNGEVVIADRVEEVTILFADLVGFTAAAARVTPAVLVNNLNRIFSAFDDLCQRLQIEKIKTIGDAYMAAAGVPLPRADHAEVMADFALAMLAALERVNAIADIVPDAHRHSHRAGCRRRDRLASVPLRHLGRHGESGQPPESQACQAGSRLTADPPVAGGPLPS